MRRLLVVLLLASFAPAARGQAAAAALAIGGLDKLLEKIEFVNVYYGWRLGGIGGDSIKSNGAAPFARDYGLEFLLHMTDGGSGPLVKRSLWTFWKPEPTAAEKFERLARKDPEAARKQKLEAERLYDTTEITFKKFTDANGTETKVKLHEAKSPTDPRYNFDMGIGYGQVDGIRANIPLEMHGNLRELPSISSYGSVRLLKNLSMYGGARTGLVSLQDAQFYLRKRADRSFDSLDVAKTSKDSSVFVTYSAAASTFELGLAVGFDVGIKDIDFTFEYAYAWRHFNTLNYSPASMLPVMLPHELNFSGRTFYTGIQLPFPKKKE